MHSRSRLVLPVGGRQRQHERELFLEVAGPLALPVQSGEVLGAGEGLDPGAGSVSAASTSGIKSTVASWRRPQDTPPAAACDENDMGSSPYSQQKLCGPVLWSVRRAGLVRLFFSFSSPPQKLCALIWRARLRCGDLGCGSSERGVSPASSDGPGGRRSTHLCGLSSLAAESRKHAFMRTRLHTPDLVGEKQDIENLPRKPSHGWAW